MNRKPLMTLCLILGALAVVAKRLLPNWEAAQRQAAAFTVSFDAQTVDQITIAGPRPPRGVASGRRRVAVTGPVERPGGWEKSRAAAGSARGADR